MVSVFLLSFSQDLYIVKSGGFAYYDKKALKGDFMNGKTVEDYKREMLEMYTRAQSVAVAATPSENLSDFSGGLQINATTLRRILPVEGAVVTVFTGSSDSPTVIETDITDNSGKTGVFKLATPNRAFSENATSEETPYALYNARVKADGYVERIFMNIPVFSGVVSVQGVDLVSISAAGDNTAPQVSDELPDYNL